MKFAFVRRNIKYLEIFQLMFSQLLLGHQGATEDLAQRCSFIVHIICTLLYNSSTVSAVEQLNSLNAYRPAEIKNVFIV